MSDWTNVEPVLDERLADRAHRDAGDGDPDLHRADEAHGVVHQLERVLRALRVRLHELLQAVAPRCYERVLGRDEDRVPQHEQENHDDSKEIAHAPLSGA